MDKPAHPHLPYHDRKAEGAADFYFAVNATFRFVQKRFGCEGLVRYWQDLGLEYMKPVHQKWKEGGASAIADYWRDFFSAEPGAEVAVTHEGEEVLIDVQTCPAIAQLRKGGREIVPEFCQHCYFVSQAAAESAGYEVRVCGGNGSCQQRFSPTSAAVPPQDLKQIHTSTLKP